jgi:hypothetical protein
MRDDLAACDLRARFGDRALSRFKILKPKGVRRLGHNRKITSWRPSRRP